MLYLEVNEIAALRQAVLQLTNYVKRKKASQDEIYTSKLIAYELVTNVLRHSGCQARLSARVKDGLLELTVESQDECLRTIKQPSLTDSGGRGLYIVNQLCHNLVLEKNKATAYLKLSKQTVKT